MSTNSTGQTQNQKARLLIVSDESNPTLQAEMNLNEVEITHVANVEDLRQACFYGYDLVVVDVAPASVVNVLVALRGSDSCKDVSVLVDTTRLDGEASLAGVLPT